MCRRDGAGTCLEDVNEAVVLSPQSDYVLWVRSGFRLFALDDVDGARADWQRSAAINPAYLENHELQGQILLREGDFAGSDAAFSRLIERGARDPLQPYRLFMRGITRFCGRDFDGAERDAAAGGDVRPNEAGHLKLRALALKELGRIDEAEACLSRAARLSLEPTMTTKPPVLPPEYRWILNALRPQSG